MIVCLTIVAVSIVNYIIMNSPPVSTSVDRNSAALAPLPAPASGIATTMPLASTDKPYVEFLPINNKAYLTVFAVLFTVALFVERAVEVIMLVLRDGDAQPLQDKVDNAQDKFDELKIINPQNTPSRGELEAAQQALTEYKGHTKEYAMRIAFVLSMVASMAGVRAFSIILNGYPVYNYFFTTMDIVVTGAVLAGGSEPIHQMANVLNDFMGALSAKAQS